MTLEQQIAQYYLPKGGVNVPTPFTQLVPRETIVNRPMIDEFAYSRVNPEVNRAKALGMESLMNNMSATGGLRFGTSNVRQQRLGDQYERQRKEMAQGFINEGTNRMSDYYNQLMGEYYRDPNAFEYKPVSIQNKLNSVVQPNTMYNRQSNNTANQTLSSFYK